MNTELSEAAAYSTIHQLPVEHADGRKEVGRVLIQGPDGVVTSWPLPEGRSTRTPANAWVHHLNRAYQAGYDAAKAGRGNQ